MPALIELEKAYREAERDHDFQAEFRRYLAEYAGRETPLYFARRLTEKLGGARIYLKREDLNHTGSHKINNTLGQALLARRMGKKLVIAETGAGQHGVATATVAALFGMGCRVFMGEEDIRRQAPNVFRMKILGTEVVPVHSGTATLKDAMNEAMRQWVAHVRDTFYVIGTTAGPHPYPMMVRNFQSVIGRETKRQVLKREGRLPDYLIACVGGGSNAMGLFYPFRKDTAVSLVGVEAAGKGIATGLHAASISAGKSESFTATRPSSSRTTPVRYGTPIPSRPASTIRAWGRSTAISTRPGGPGTSTSPTRRPYGPSWSCRDSKASYPPWRAPTRSPTP